MVYWDNKDTKSLADFVTLNGINCSTVSKEMEKQLKDIEGYKLIFAENL